MYIVIMFSDIKKKKKKELKSKVLLKLFRNNIIKLVITNKNLRNM